MQASQAKESLTMAKYIGSKCRLCRREGVKLYLKGARCLTPKCPITKRGTQPGMHGKNKPKLTEYGKQLREKQKAKRIYGLTEAQCRGYYKKALKAPRVNVEFATLLERRLDNILYKTGVAMSRAQGRQMISHGLFTLNGKQTITVPSILLRPGDFVEIRVSKRDKGIFKQESTVSTIPGWLEVDRKNLKIACTRKLESADVSDVEFDPQAIVEFYSR